MQHDSIQKAAIAAEKIVQAIMNGAKIEVGTPDPNAAWPRQFITNGAFVERVADGEVDVAATAGLVLYKEAVIHLLVGLVMDRHALQGRIKSLSDTDAATWKMLNKSRDETLAARRELADAAREKSLTICIDGKPVMELVGSMLKVVNEDSEPW